MTGLDNEQTAAYLAGLIDGEGTIGIYTVRSPRSIRTSFYVQVTITNTSTALMDWLAVNIGGRVDRRHDERSRNPTHRQPYAWRVHGTNVDILLHAIGPFLVVKREQALVAIELRSLHRHNGRALTDEEVIERQVLKDRMHVLNARGVP